MTGQNRETVSFLASYQGQFRIFKEIAEAAHHAVERAVQETGIVVHAVSARAKTLESVRGKLRRKQYSDPARDMTDIVGVRVITYYRDDVDPIVARLQKAFEIDGSASTDKRLALDLRGFGYRSVHLIARFPAKLMQFDSEKLDELQFEIQVRSILEHAWAEIEHQIVYKSGITQPDNTLRSFAALAGTLELLDSQFLSLRNESKYLIESYRANYTHKQDQRKTFDVARLLGFLEATRPGRTWQQSASGTSRGGDLAVSCVDAMKTVGLGTASSLARMFKSQRFRYALRSFAADNGIGPDEVSHLASVVLAVAVKKPRVVQERFPEMMYDPTIQAMVERRARRR